jgi:hypothetical protein
MTGEWYCQIAGREIGPLSSQQLKAMAVKGQILPNDCVRQGPYGVWVPAAQVKGLLPPAEPLPAKPAASPPPISNDPPVARPFPQPPESPVVILTDAPAAVLDAKSPSGVPILPSARRRRQQEKMLIIILLILIAVLALAGLAMILSRGSDSSDADKDGFSVLAEKTDDKDLSQKYFKLIESTDGANSRSLKQTVLSTN